MRVKDCSVCSKELELSEFNKRAVTKDGVRAECRDCQKLESKRYSRDNAEKISIAGKAHYLENKERINARHKTTYHANSKAVLARQKERRDPEEVKIYSAAYYQKNKVKKNAASVAYRLRRERRTPAWAELELMKEVYREASARAGEFHVDHIIPLHGKLVSGLHVLSNLQILTAKDNRVKANSYGH